MSNKVNVGNKVNQVKQVKQVKRKWQFEVVCIFNG